MNCPVIEVAQGYAKGKILKGTRDVQEVSVFLGLPYAAAPVGQLRFERPCAAHGWLGIRKADKFGDRCVQRNRFSDMSFRSTGMSEDCLSANVWVPEEAYYARLPILVYIHGGALVVGDGSEPRYDGAALAAQGLVVVTVNFRIGIFGFFAHPDLDGANVGLLDLAAAIDWVRENALAFGGDPDKITIMGSSSGGFAATALAVSPQMQGRIYGAVIQSGSLLGASLSGLCSELPPVDTLRRRGETFTNRAGGLEVLKNMSAEALLNMSSAAGWSRPVLDRDILPFNLCEAFCYPESGAINLMAGCTSAERSFDANVGPPPTSPEVFRRQLDNRYGARAEQVYAAYGSPQTDEQLRAAACELETDSWIGADTIRVCQQAAAAGGSVFSYVFDHVQPLAGTENAGWMSEQGACHSSDIEYFLGTQKLNTEKAWTEEDWALSAQMQKQLVSFVSNGNPNGPGLPDWPLIQEGKRIVLSTTGGIRGLDPAATLTEITCM